MISFFIFHGRFEINVNIYIFQIIKSLPKSKLINFYFHCLQLKKAHDRLSTSSNFVFPGQKTNDHLGIVKNFSFCSQRTNERGKNNRFVTVFEILYFTVKKRNSPLGATVNIGISQ